MNKDVRKWICVFFAFVFLISSTWQSIQVVFYSDKIMIFLGIISVLSSVLTLIFAVFSIPKWQSFFGFAVFIYSIFWFATSEVGIH
jgi:hypothetical protein